LEAGPRDSAATGTATITLSAVGTVNISGPALTLILNTAADPGALTVLDLENANLAAVTALTIKAPAVSFDTGSFALTGGGLTLAALNAATLVGLKFNLPKNALADITAQLPALRNPTISSLSNPDWLAVETIIDHKAVREIIPTLKANKAEGIVEYPLNKVVY